MNISELRADFPQYNNLDDYTFLRKIHQDYMPDLDFQEVTRAVGFQIPSRSVGNIAGDMGLSLAKGVVGTGEAAVGLLDILTGGYAGKALSAVGYDPIETRRVIESGYSIPQQEANRRVSDAEGLAGTAKAIIQNPSTILQSGIETSPLMLGGGGIARGAMQVLPKMSPVLAAALGEGGVTAGITAEQIRQQNESGTLTPGQIGMSVAAGAGTGIIGIIGGRIAKKLGFADVDTLLAGAKLNNNSSSVAKRIVEGGISEGVLEELPQSAQEQIWSNAAMDRPLMEGVEESAVQGMMVGGIMGGGANVIAQGPKNNIPPTATQPDNKQDILATIKEDFDAGNLTPEIIAAIKQQLPQLSNDIDKITAQPDEVIKLRDQILEKGKEVGRKLTEDEVIELQNPIPEPAKEIVQLDNEESVQLKAEPIKVQRSSDEAGENTQYEVIEGPQKGSSISRGALTQEPEKYVVDESLMPSVAKKAEVNINDAMAKELEKAQVKKKVKILEFKTYDEAQNAIDDYETKLMDEGKSDAEMDKDEYLKSLYDSRNKIGQTELEQSYNEILNAVDAEISDKELADKILKNIYDIDPTSETGQYFAAQYTQRQVKNRANTREKILNAVKEDYGQKNNLDMDGVFSSMSGLSKPEQRDLLKSLTDKSAKIETAVYEYFNGKETPEPAKELEKAQVKKATRAESLKDLGQMGKAISDNFREMVYNEVSQGKSQSKAGIAEQMAEKVFKRGYTSKEDINKALNIGQTIQDKGLKGSELQKEAGQILNESFPLKPEAKAPQPTELTLEPAKVEGKYSERPEVKEYLGDKNLSSQTHDLDALEESINTDPALSNLTSGEAIARRLDTLVERSKLPEPIKDRRVWAPEGYTYEGDRLVKLEEKSKKPPLPSPKPESKAVQPTELTESGGKTKEPWEMNEDELASQDNDWYKNKQHQIPLDKFVTIGVNRNYIKIDGEYYNILANGEIGSKVEPDLIKNQKDEAAKSHRYFVEKALKKGKPVPEEVLKDYPDLKPTDIVVEGKGEEITGQENISNAIDSFFNGDRKPKKVTGAQKSQLEKQLAAINRSLKNNTIPADSMQTILERKAEIEEVLGQKPSEEKPAGEKVTITEEQTKILTEYPKSRKATEIKESVGIKSKPGSVYLDKGGRKPFFEYKEIKRGNVLNKGKYRITLTNGKKVVVNKEAIKEWPQEAQEVTDAKARIISKFKEEKGSLSLNDLKTTPIYKDLLTVGNHYYSQGMTRFQDFRNAMQETFSDVWDKIKQFVSKIFRESVRFYKESKLGEERGSISFEDKAKPKLSAEDYAKNLIARAGKKATQTTEAKKPVEKTKKAKESDNFGISELWSNNDKAKESLNKFATKAGYWLVDKNIPIQAVQKDLKTFREDLDLFLSETQRPKITASKIKQMWEDRVEPLLKAIAESNYDLGTFEEYKHAKHAPERNEAMRKANAKRYIEKVIAAAPKETKALQEEIKDLLWPEEWYAKIDDVFSKYGKLDSVKDIKSQWDKFSQKPSGMSDVESQKILKFYEKDKVGLDKIGKLLDGINRERIDILYNAGLLAEKEYESLKTRYKNYVPLYREGFEDQTQGTGRGLQPAGRPIKTAMGSTRQVVDIVSNSIINLENAINRAEKAESARVLVNLIKENPNPDLWTLNKVKETPRSDEFGNLKMYPDSFSVAPNEMRVMVNGQQYLISVNRNNENAMLMLKTLKAEDSMGGPIVHALSKMNRWLARINTSWSPEFVISNFVRDLQTAGININDTGVQGKQVFRGALKAIKAIHDVESGNPKGTDLEKYYDRFKKAGGKIGWSNVYETASKLSKDLIKDIETFEGKRPVRKVWKKTFDMIEDWNTSVENGIRLHTFKLAVEQGLSDKKAAQIASDLTVDFTKKGAAGQVINSLYLFANAGIQGSYRIFRAGVKSPKVRKIMGGIIGIGILNGLLNSALGGEDDDGEDYYNKIDDYVKERNMVIMIPGSKGKYIKIPLPWGYNVFWNIGDELSKIFTKEDYSATEGAGRLLSVFAQAFNPIQSGTLLQTLSPTIADPFAMVAENKNWFGGELMPAKNMFEKVPTPDSQRYWKTVSKPSKWVAEKLNDWTGGSQVRKGAIDVSPETLDLIIDTLGGSALRFFSDTASAPLKYVKDEEIKIQDIPFLRRSMGEKSEWSDQRAYYNNLEEVLTAKEELEVYKGTLYYDNFNEKLKDVKKMIPIAENTERRLRKLRKIRNKSDDKKRVEDLNNQIDKIYSDFNKKYYRTVKGD